MLFICLFIFGYVLPGVLAKIGIEEGGVGGGPIYLIPLINIIIMLDSSTYIWKWITNHELYYDNDYTNEDLK